MPKAKRDPLADPLEGPEWNGLGWSVALVATLLRGKRQNTPRDDAGEARLEAVPSRRDPRLISSQSLRLGL